MAGTVLSVLVGCLCAATLLFANSKVQQLGHASLLHLRTWTQLTDRLPPLIRGIGQSSDIPAFVEVYRQEYTSPARLGRRTTTTWTRRRAAARVSWAPFNG